MIQLSITQKLFLGILFITPTFTLLIKGWTGILLVIAAIFAIFILSINPAKNLTTTFNPLQKKMIWGVIITFTSPCLAILMSQVFQNKFSLQTYDAPSKFLLAIPIFLLLTRLKVNLEKLIEYIFPTTLLLTLLFMPFLPKTGWGIYVHRVTTYFVDHLTFGRICIAFAILSLATLNFKKPIQLSNLFKLLGVLAGIYLSINSGSRTGWLALPLALALIVSIQFQDKLKAFLTGAIVAISVSLVMYQNIETVKQRTNDAINEISTYQMDSVNPDNSVGQRISFIRMGIYYFSLNPLSGWGDHGFKSHINDAEITKFTSEYTRQFALNAGFHNEFITNAVRSGIWGIIATALLFFIPLWILITSRKLTEYKNLRYLGILYIICEFISGMSTEVFNLKFTASLYAIMISIILGCLISSIKNEHQKI